MSGETNGRAVINLTTGHEDADLVTVAFLVGTAGLAAGKDVVMFLTKEAVRLATPGYADAIETAGAPPVAKLFAQFAEGGGELYACPICFDARRLDHGEPRAERAHRGCDAAVGVRRRGRNGVQLLTR